MNRPVDDIDIGLGRDQILQRFLVRRIFREAEFCVTGHDGARYDGFITGFDDRCLQLSTTPETPTDEPRAVVLFWPIRSIEETGRRADDLDPENRSRIRRYSHALRSQCERVLSGGKNGRRVDVVEKAVFETPPLFSSEL